jgi:hypothetical protein
MSKSKIQVKFDAGESINWFELIEWEKKVLEEQRLEREKRKKSDQTKSCAGNVDRIVKMELLAADAKETENQLVPESSDPISLKSLLETDEFKLSHELSEQQADTAGSRNKPTASTSGLFDSLPGPSESLNADEKKLKTSQKRKKHQVNESSSDGNGDRRNLERKCSEISSASQSKSDKNPNPPLNGKLENDPGFQALSKNQKIESPVAAKRSRIASSGTTKSDKRKKFWECDQCGKKFGHQKSHLSRHLQTHFTTKNLKCSICQKAFKTSDDRRQHEQRHTDPKVQCKICGKKVKNRFVLSNHLSYCHSNRENPTN